MCRRRASRRASGQPSQSPNWQQFGLCAFHPERTLLYQTVAEHDETWLDLASVGQFDRQGDYRTPKPCVRQALAKYLKWRRLCPRVL